MHPDGDKGDFYQPEPFEIVSFIVGMPGPDYDQGIFLRKEGDDYVVWSQVWHTGPFIEMRFGRLFPEHSPHPNNVKEAERLKAHA